MPCRQSCRPKRTGQLSDTCPSWLPWLTVTSSGSRPTPTESAAATFCATLIDEWHRAGVTDAFAAPGSRSTPMALALINDDRIRLHVFHDERSASFAALGNAAAGGNPTVVTATSGTAPTHFLGAVTEASLAGIPLIVCTTDRPPELQSVGAPQTIGQDGLFGDKVRFFTNPGLADASAASFWRSLGSRLVAEARGASGRPGPVQINLPFRDPLVGEPGEKPPGRPAGAPWHQDARPARSSGEPGEPGVAARALEVWHRIRGLSGVVVAGQGTSDPSAVLALARRLGWPVLADHRSGCRAESHAVTHFDAILRSDRFVEGRAVDVVLRFGEPPASKVLGQHIQRWGADVIVAHELGRWSDPERLAALFVPEYGLARAMVSHIPSDYESSDEAMVWRQADQAAAEVVAEAMATPEGSASEIGIARHAVESMPSGGALVVSSSMPVRDVEWFAPNRRNVQVYANRGANGIDGVVSTAIGVALTGTPTTLLIGDVAFLHDSAALIALNRRRIDLTIIVVDNNGGGIFSFLPQASLVSSETFEQLFGTPHGTDLVTLCRAHGLPAVSWAPGDPTPGEVAVRVLVAKTERSANVKLHDKLNAAIVEAVDQLDP